MDFKKILLYAALAIVGFMLWYAWLTHQAQPQETVVTDTSAAGVVAQSSAQAITNQPQSTGVAANSTTGVVTSHAANMDVPDNRKIIITTDVLQLTVDLLGGEIIESKLLDYADDLNNPEQKINLLNTNNASLYTAKSGLVPTGDALSSVEPILFSSAQSSYQLQQHENEVVALITGYNNDGLQVEKRITIPQDSYNVRVEYTVANNSNSVWRGSLFAELQRRYQEKSSGLFMMPTFSGAAISTPDKPFEKIKFSKMSESPVDKYGQGGWAAMVEHYFVSAWIPSQEQTNRFYSYVGPQLLYTIGTLSPELTIVSGEQYTTQLNLYTGPEIAERLKEVAPKLDLTVDYGFLWPISKTLFWVLDFIYDYVGNWGWAIVLLTLLIKLMFYHLSAKSYRSMARMRTLQPKIQALKERLGDDRQKMGQATIELYKKEKINPLGGCLPILVQIPVFIALYWVLLESVELRHAPFILWIQDLTVRDPYFVLPVLMGVTMYIQQVLSPAPPDPVQAKVMKLLPLIFTAFFMMFPAGLVLYWTVNNAVSVLQQWYLTRKVEAESK